ncbi:MAG: FeoB-associated Cys-rich membrane protein [Desulfuromonadales bacterium]|nr:FeoB-associated Cys-rich membrane protein [Desulfuromonadales bacterium]
MGVVDVIWMVLILGAAGYLFYRSVIKKKGHCPGCDHGSCDKK